MQINLVQGGIFPIKDNLTNDSTGFKYAGTFQGEGKLTGTACLFIRTSACNLRCAWVGLDGKGSPCDTPYSSHNPEKNKMEIDDIRLEGTVCDLGFTEQGGGTDFASNLPKGGRANLIKIYSTMYKIILTIAKAKAPNNILLSSYDQSGYFPYYNNLTKTNNIPGYSRKAIVKWTHNGKNITSIVLNKNKNIVKNPANPAQICKCLILLRKPCHDKDSLPWHEG